MNYFILRNEQQYGPYTLADLQRYVASGQISPADLARSEGMSQPVPVSQIIGTIAVPQTYPPPPGQFAQNAIVSGTQYPDPPNLNWGLVLVFGIFTCGLFNLVWGIVQAVWMRSVAPQSKALYYYIGAAGALAAIFVVSFQAAATHAPNTMAGLVNIGYCILLLIGRFSLRSSLEQHYNTAEPIGLALSGVMTFFFGDIYFQYHLNDIVRRKSVGRANFRMA
jgi:hypothetical protein